MEYFATNDGSKMAYQDVGSKSLAPLILLHGFTGSSQVFKRNIPALSARYRVIAPDLRGHGSSAKTPHGFHVSRLAMDLHNLLAHLGLAEAGSVRCIAGSLGCAILWCYAELFTADVFSHMIWVDQAPMQNYAFDGSWGSAEGNRGMNSATAVATLKATLKYDPDAVYRGTIAGCLGYRSHPVQGAEGVPEWYGDLMADHTALDWRQSIVQSFGMREENRTKVLVVATDRSGCFPSKGCMEAVRFANTCAKREKQRAEGVVVDWGGHWCYWENPEKFNHLVLNFLAR
ncbi:hypothetical protein MBLNU459_g5017t2 [Dothideomycetes sp. NU459]